MIPAVIQDLERARTTLKPKADNDYIVSTGGDLVLVPTGTDIESWKPIASKRMDGIVWKWVPLH